MKLDDVMARGEVLRGKEEGGHALSLVPPSERGLSPLTLIVIFDESITAHLG